MLFRFVVLSALIRHSLAGCNADNCLRAMQNRAATASAFCSAYTTTANTATTALPTYATACSNAPSRISSACTCLHTATTLSTTTSTTPTPSCVKDLPANENLVVDGQGNAAPWTYSIYTAPQQTSSPSARFQISTSTYGTLYAALFQISVSLTSRPPIIGSNY